MVAQRFERLQPRPCPAVPAGARFSVPLCYFDGHLLPGSARAHPGGATGTHTRELCQSVCSSAICLTPRTRRNCANISRASARRPRSCLPVDRETGRPRGFAFVDYADRGVAEEAIRRFNQQPFKGPAARGQRGASARGARAGRTAPAGRVQRSTAGRAPVGPGRRRGRAASAVHRARAASRHGPTPVAPRPRARATATSARTRRPRTSASRRARTATAAQGTDQGASGRPALRRGRGLARPGRGRRRRQRRDRRERGRRLDVVAQEDEAGRGPGLNG